MNSSMRRVAVLVMVFAVVGVGLLARRRSRAYDTLVNEAFVYLDSVQAANKVTYRLGDYAHYDYDQDRATIVFSDSARTPRVVARIQMVGDISNRTRTWLWAWANPSIDSALAESARRVRAIGKSRGFSALRDSLWDADEQDGWNMTSITAKLTQAKGAYRSPGDSGAVFMVFTDIRWASPADSMNHGCDSGCFAAPGRRSSTPDQ